MGGMERASVNLANGVSNLGYSCSYVALFKQNRFFDLNKNINFYEPEGFNIYSLSLFKTIRWIRKLVTINKWKSVLVFNKLYGSIVCFALRNTGVKVFISERSSPLYYWGWRVESLSKILYTIAKPAGIIAQTTIAANYQRKYYGKNVLIKVIPNALRPVKRYDDVKRNKTILAVGRLGDPLKGFDQLIEALALLKDKEWKLEIAGGTSQGHELTKRIEELKLGARVTFLGQVKDLDPVYARAGIFVIPSRSEGFPNALCEAMAAGCPCIAFDFVAGPRDIIKPGFSGSIVPSGNIELLSHEMQKLIDSPSIRNKYSKNACLIVDKLAPELICKKTVQFVLE